MQKITLLFLTLLALTSCKKSTNTGPSRSELIAGSTSKTWQITALTSKDAAGAERNDLAAQAACKRDDILIFFPDKRLEGREGATKCNATDPDLVQAGNWSLSSDGADLTIPFNNNGTTLPVTFRIVEISATSIKGTFLNPLNQRNYTAIFTAKM